MPSFFSSNVKKPKETVYEIRGDFLPKELVNEIRKRKDRIAYRAFN